MKAWIVVAIVGVAVLSVKAEAEPPARSCLLMWKMGSEYQRTPMPGFDPAMPGPLILPEVDGQPSMVICAGASLLPEPKDYRVLNELRLPVGYTDGKAMVFLVIDRGQLKFAFPTEGAASLDQLKAQAMLDQMQTAMQDEISPRK
jgi:hypothetical protein